MKMESKILENKEYILKLKSTGVPKNDLDLDTMFNVYFAIYGKDSALTKRCRACVMKIYRKLINIDLNEK